MRKQSLKDEQDNASRQIPAERDGTGDEGPANSRLLLCQSYKPDLHDYTETQVEEFNLEVKTTGLRAAGQPVMKLNAALALCVRDASPPPPGGNVCFF